MIRYLIARYLLALVGVGGAFAALNVLFGSSCRSGLSSGLCWGAFGAGCVTYFDFRRQNLWVLYDNLGISKPLLLGGLVLLFYLVGAGLGLRS